MLSRDRARRYFHASGRRRHASPAFSSGASHGARPCRGAGRPESRRMWRGGVFSPSATGSAGGAGRRVCCSCRIGDVMSIRMKFVWGFLLCIVVSAGIVSGISVWKLNELSGADFRQASGHQLQVTNRFISLFFQENISKLRFLSNLPLIPQTAGHFPNFSQTTQDTMYVRRPFRRRQGNCSPCCRTCGKVRRNWRKSSSVMRTAA